MSPLFIAELVLGIVDKIQSAQMDTVNYGTFQYSDKEQRPLFTLTVIQQGDQDSLYFVGLNIKAEDLRRIADIYAEKYEPKSISID